MAFLFATMLGASAIITGAELELGDPIPGSPFKRSGVGEIVTQGIAKLQLGL